MAGIHFFTLLIVDENKMVTGGDLNNYEYPINIVVELKSSAVELDFEVMLVYYEAGK